MHIYYFIVFSFPISKKGPFYLRTYYHVNCLLWMALWLVKEHWEWCFLREKAEWHIFAFALLFVCHVFAAEDKRPEQERCWMQGIRYPGKPDFALYDCMRLAKHEGSLLHFSRIKQCRCSVWLFSILLGIWVSLSRRNNNYTREINIFFFYGIFFCLLFFSLHETKYYL